MKKIFLTKILTFTSFVALGQTDTSVIKDQKGFLILSNYNNQYDFRDGEVRILGFHDYFFPINSLDSTWFTEQNIAIAFKNGVRVDHINNRLPLKESAFQLMGSDTSKCYPYNKFYILPVLISYKIFEDNWPYNCDRNFFNFQINHGPNLHFEYIHKAISPFNIIPIIKPNSKHRTSTQNK